MSLFNFFIIRFCSSDTFQYLCKMNFTQAVLDWFAINGRDLPWRKSSDPYTIWLSEVILQQTRIVQGQAYWERFIARWKTVDELANATEDEVLREWQGLGYYSRARNLYKAAKQVVTMGSFPKTFEELKRLKGVGDYTAAAIASFAFNEPVAVVDGNVFRVLSRYFGIETPIDSAQGKKDFKVMAQECLARDCPAEYNQAIMDFGALQCTPVSPDCNVCPLVETCYAHAHHAIDKFPVKSKKIVQRERKLVYVYIRYNDSTVIHRRGAGDIWQGLWEFPTSEALDFPFSELRLIKRGIKHLLTHQIIFADFYLWEPFCRPNLPSGYKWVKEDELGNYAFPKLLQLLANSL